MYQDSFKVPKISALLFGLLGMSLFAGAGKHIVTGAVVGFSLGSAFGVACGFIILGIVAIIPQVFRGLIGLLKVTLSMIVIAVLIAAILAAFVLEFG